MTHFWGDSLDDSARFSEFDAGNMISFQIKVFGRNFK